MGARPLELMPVWFFSGLAVGVAHGVYSGPQQRCNEICVHKDGSLTTSQVGDLLARAVGGEVTAKEA